MGMDEMDGQPGCYYKIGATGEARILTTAFRSNWRNGYSSRVYITFRSWLASHIMAAYTSKLFENIKSVAEGAVR